MSANDSIVLQGEDLLGLEFVASEDGPLLVNGQLAPGALADSVTDMCGVIISLTLTPRPGLARADLERWLAGVRAPVWKDCP